MTLTYRKLAEEISAIKPGSTIAVTYEAIDFLVDRPPVGYSPSDWLMELIVGSAYEFMLWHDESMRLYRFSRLTEPLPFGTRTYVSPDRRGDFQLGPDKLWRLRP
jgi:hypothetical protein